MNFLLVNRDTILSTQDALYGTEMVLLNLAHALSALGHKVVVAAQLDGPEESANGIQFWDLSPKYDIPSTLERAQTLGNYHLIAIERALPIMLSRSDPHCLSRSLLARGRSVNDIGLKLSALSMVVDNFIVPSKFQRRVLLDNGADESKLVVIEEGVSKEHFFTSNAAPRASSKILFVGNPIEENGFHTLAEAYRLLKPLLPNISLDVYGSFNSSGRPKPFNERALENKLPGLRFHAPVSQAELGEALRNATLLVSPVLIGAPSALAAIEALHCGCPVVASNIGALGETIVSGQNGILLNLPDAQELAEAMQDVIKHPTTFSQVAPPKSDHIQTWDEMAGQIADLCHETSQTDPTTHKGEIMETNQGKIGFLSTWNQECGLATYAKYLVAELPPESYIVLAEKLSSPPALEDEPFVDRSWSRQSADYSQLRSSIDKHHISVLHLNCHYRFFHYPEIQDFLQSLRLGGVKVIAHLHNPYTIDPHLKALVSAVHEVIVHTPENRLEVIANGADPEQVTVVPHGVVQQTPLSTNDRVLLRKKLGMPVNAKILVSFGFIQAHKGLDGLIEGVAHLVRQGIDCYGYIAGHTMPSDPSSAQYLEKLHQLAEALGVSNRISIPNRFVSETEVTQYLQAADVVLMNYYSQYYEASGACSLAVGAGAVVAASIAPPLMAFGEAVWHITSGYPVPLSLQILLTNEELRNTLQRNAKSYSATNSWKAIAGKLVSIYSKHGLELAIPSAKQEPESNKLKEAPVDTPSVDTKPKPLSVLMQNRPNALSQPGGDTVVMEQTAKGLRGLGVEVVIDVEARQNPANFDLVHLFNFATPDYTKQLAEKAHTAGVPYVVTTLCEDVPTFRNQSLAYAEQLVEYVRNGQSKEWWSANKPNLSSIPPAPAFQNEWTARHAAALLTTGTNETEVLSRYYPGLSNLQEVLLGHEVHSSANPELFTAEYGVKDFILCVGRFEDRKNQLMLLKALEDSEIPVVLASGGFTYQPGYEQAVSSFKRKGETIILGRVSQEMLASAYAAAKLHVLPSWHELPGLVGLEAASYGLNIVATASGTTQNYLGELAFYCEPWNESSILNAILAAYYSPRRPELATKSKSFTWLNTAQSTFEVYKTIIKRPFLGMEQTVSSNPREEVWPNVKVPATQVAKPVASTFQSPEPKALAQQASAPSPQTESELQCSSEVKATIDGAEEAAREKKFEKAYSMLVAAEEQHPKNVALLKAHGAIYLAEGKLALAKKLFEQANLIDPRDPKVLCGLGMCSSFEEKLEKAYGCFIAALAIDPSYGVAVHQLMRCAYALNRFEDLERALHAYLSKVPSDVEMKYCLGGCLYKTGKYQEALSTINQVLSVKPGHTLAKELHEMLVKIPQSAQPEVPSQEVPVLASKEEGLSEKQQSGFREENWGQAKDENQVVKAKTPNPISTKSVEVASSPATPPSLMSQIAELEELKRQGEYEEAKKGCIKLLSSDTLSSEEKEKTLLLRAEASVLQGEVSFAEGEFKRILESNPKSVRAMCGLGAISASRGQWEVAKQHFEEAIAVTPEADVALSGLGVCATQANDKNGAWQYFDKALKANPENKRALLGLIENGYPLKRLSEIEDAIRGYLEMHPADLEFLYSLAGCYFAQNKLNEAASQLETIMLFKPGDKRAQELQSAIESKMQGA